MKVFEEYVVNRDLFESGYARARRMMFGDVPSIVSVGVVTAHNPMGRPPMPEPGETVQQANDRLNKKLENELRAANYGPIKSKGKFGGEEESFLIPNIPREHLVDLGRRYNQEAVIWGQKQADESGNPFFNFEYIEGGNTVDTRTVHVGNADVQNRDDFYTMVKGRKFIIPFFGDPYAKYRPGKKYGTIELPPEDDGMGQVHKAETFSVPGLDDGATWEFLGEQCEISYYSDRLLRHPNPAVSQVLREVRECEEQLQQGGSVGKHYWMWRGKLHNALARLTSL